MVNARRAGVWKARQLMGVVRSHDGHRSRAVVPVALTLVSCCLCLVLAGCAGAGSVTHQMVSSEGSCVSCHADDRRVDAGATPIGATVCNGTVEVTTDADAVYVCRPLCVQGESSTYVPLAGTRVGVEDGVATVQLDEGIWVVCIDKGDAVRGELVEASAASGESLSLTLK